MTSGRPARQYSQASRVHTLIRLIETRQGVTVSELAEILSVSKRTIYRDIIALEEAGYPILSEKTDGEAYYYFLTKTDQGTGTTFTIEELLSLQILKGISAQLPASLFQKDIDTIIQKVHASLPPRAVAHLERITAVPLPRFQGRISSAPPQDVEEAIRKALLLQYRLHIHYRKGPNDSQTYRIEPYTLVLAKGGAYLLAFTLNRNAMRLFAMERIVSAAVQAERFEIPEGFQPESCFNDAFGLVSETPHTIEVLFSPTVAHRIEGRVWHPHQSTTTHADGSITLTFTASGTMEIIAWILSFGQHAEIIQPQVLRDALQQHLSILHARYQQETA